MFRAVPAGQGRQGLRPQCALHRFGRHDNTQGVVGAPDVDRERRSRLTVHVGVFVARGEGVQVAALDVDDARRIALAQDDIGQVAHGGAQRSERAVALQDQYVEQAVVALRLVGDGERAGRAAVEDEEDHRLAVEVAAVGADRQVHAAEAGQVADAVDVVGDLAEVVFPGGGGLLGDVREEAAAEDIDEVAAVGDAQVDRLDGPLQDGPARLHRILRHAEQGGEVVGRADGQHGGGDVGAAGLDVVDEVVERAVAARQQQVVERLGGGRLDGEPVGVVEAQPVKGHAVAVVLIAGDNVVQIVRYGMVARCGVVEEENVAEHGGVRDIVAWPPRCGSSSNRRVGRRSAGRRCRGAPAAGRAHRPDRGR